MCEASQPITLKRAVRRSLTEKVIFEFSPEGSEKASHTGVSGGVRKALRVRKAKSQSQEYACHSGNHQGARVSQE